jgi:hypothetical protein
MKIGILTSGGDCPGLNAVIRGAVLKGIKAHGHTFVGFHDGWRGVVDGDVLELPRERVRGISKQGGTILGTSRTNPFDGPNGGAANIKSTLKSLGVDALIAIGGEGTLAAAKRLSQEGLNMVGVPKTVDNDLAATDYTFGFDTAVQIATKKPLTGCGPPASHTTDAWSQKSWDDMPAGSPSTRAWQQAPTPFSSLNNQSRQTRSQPGSRTPSGVAVPPL